MFGKWKSSLIILPIALLLNACMGGGGPEASGTPTASSSAESTASVSPEATQANPRQALLLAFMERADADAPPEELFPLFRETIAQADAVTADELVRSIIVYYNRNLVAVGQPFEGPKEQLALSDLEWPVSEDQISSIENTELRERVERLYAGGHKLESAEGFIFPIVDYGKLRSVSGNASAEVQTYLELLARESDNRSNSDGGLLIDWKELAQRTLAAESYVVAFPESPERDEVELMFVTYLDRYLTGMENTPITDGEYFKLLPEVESEYARMSEDHGETATGRLTRDWLDVLATTDGVVMDRNEAGERVVRAEVAAFREGIETRARALLPGSDSVAYDDGAEGEDGGEADGKAGNQVGGEGG